MIDWLVAAAAGLLGYGLACLVHGKRPAVREQMIEKPNGHPYRTGDRPVEDVKPVHVVDWAIRAGTVSYRCECPRCESDRSVPRLNFCTCGADPAEHLHFECDSKTIGCGFVWVMRAKPLKRPQDEAPLAPSTEPEAH